jgi:glycerophosphoryl diester phosphodiesterase
VSSFHLEVVDRVRTAAGGSVPTGFLSFGLDPHSALAVVHEHGHDAVHPDVWTLVQAHGAGVDVAAFVTRAHELGVRVHVWTVNDVAQVEQLRDAGVDAVITDDDALYAFGATGRRP